MMRLDLTALDSNARHGMLEQGLAFPEPGATAKPFVQTVATALCQGDLPRARDGRSSP
jgi:hypothetical protein